MTAEQIKEVIDRIEELHGSPVEVRLMQYDVPERPGYYFAVVDSLGVEIGVGTTHDAAVANALSNLVLMS